LPDGRRRRPERGMPPGSSTWCTTARAGRSAGTPMTPPNLASVRQT
jgi:hypothetical protein